MKNNKLIPSVTLWSNFSFGYIMKLRFSLAIFILTSFSFLSFQTSPTVSIDANNKFAQFLVLDVATEEEYHTIEHYIRTKPGILKTKIDTKTGILFCLFTANAHIDETSFAHWLSMEGYSLSCYKEGIEGVNPVFNKDDFQCM